MSDVLNWRLWRLYRRPPLRPIPTQWGPRRVWWWGGPRLVSVTVPLIWHGPAVSIPDTPLVGHLTKAGWVVPPRGFHSLHDVHALLADVAGYTETWGKCIVIGQVAVSGEVVEGERGHIAQQQVVRGLVPTAFSCTGGRERAQLMDPALAAGLTTRYQCDLITALPPKQPEPTPTAQMFGSPGWLQQALTQQQLAQQYPQP